jgi:hypothetical protein
MSDVVLLDAGPLGMISHPRARSEIVSWLARLVSAGVEVLIPEIADYEVRRELLRAGRKKGVQRLDELKESLGFVPITSSAMLRAAEILVGGAKARPTHRSGRIPGRRRDPGGPGGDIAGEDRCRRFEQSRPPFPFCARCKMGGHHRMTSRWKSVKTLGT